MPTGPHSSRGRCPCGANAVYRQCCGAIIEGRREATTAEQLMRSRYVAYVTCDSAYLQRSWHASTRPRSLILDPATQPAWSGLMILETAGGQEADDTGIVEFIANYVAEGGTGRLHERSRFRKEAGRWYYVGGDLNEERVPSPRKIGRNAPCTCGSGRKYKHCCGR